MSDSISLFDQMDPQPMRVPVGEHRPSKRMPPRARKADPETSWESAAVVGVAAHALEAEILDAFRTLGPMIDEELTLGPLIHRYAPTVITARSRLYKRGLLVATEHVRRNSRNREQIVWAAA